MRAVVARLYGGPEVLEIAEFPAIHPGPGQIRIKVEAAAVNPVDLFVRSGGALQAGVMAVRDVTGIGMDAAGTVDEVGEAVTEFQVGDQVIGISVGLERDHGSYADQLILDVTSAAHAPPSFTPTESATLILPGLTALQALDTLGLKEGQSLLVTGAAGAVGGLLVQLAAARGLRVIGAARDHDEALVLGYGAAHFLLCDDELGTAVREIIPEGVDAAIDTAVIVGPAHEAIRDNGAFLSLVMNGLPPEERGIQTSVLWAHGNCEHLADLAKKAEEGTIKVKVANTFPLSEAATAHELKEVGGVRGRIILIP